MTTKLIPSADLTPETQRSTENIPGFKVVPASEFILPESVREQGIAALRQQADLQIRRLERARNTQGASALEERLAAHLEKFEERAALKGWSSTSPIFTPI